MCGIAGAFSKTPVPASTLQRVLARMLHRGPDGGGEWSCTSTEGWSLWLGHRRLSIIDLTNAGHQPMVDSTRSMVLTYNGEIYNYLELREELSKEGVSFTGHSDSEVLLESYKTWGEACLDKLNGMFSFAIWDGQRKRLFAARDRFGEKPFLFVSKPDFFAFASEFKAILAFPQVSTDYDELALIEFGYNQGNDGGGRTPFREVLQLRPGEALTIEPGNSLTPSIRRWYNPKIRHFGAGVPDQEIFAEFRELLIDAVRLRLRSDVPLGSCLSGGLDSSAIVCIARQLIGKDAEYNTFTGVFPNSNADESRYAGIVTAQARTIAHEVEPSVQRFLQEAEEFIWLNELPVGSTSQFAQWCVFSKAKQIGVTVLLDGQGADEVLGGYEQYFDDYLKSIDPINQQSRLKDERGLIKARYPMALSPTRNRIRDRLPFRLRHLVANRLNTGSSYLFGLQPDIANKIRVQRAESLHSRNTPLHTALYSDSFGGFLTTLLRYGDRNSMAHSREVRLPFCDHRIAEFSLGVPPEILMGKVQTKRLLRESMRGILPEEIRTRWNKQGFRPPQEQWFQEPQFIAFVREVFSSESFRNNSYYVAGAWMRMLDRLQAGEVNLAWTLWQPFMAELWKLMFLRRVRSEP